MDIEWAKDGVTGKLYIVQARPETVRARQDVAALTLFLCSEDARHIQGTAIAVDRDHLSITAGIGGLIVIDVSNPRSPRVVTTVR